MSVFQAIFHHLTPNLHRAEVKEVFVKMLRKTTNIYLLSLFHLYPPTRRPYTRIREGWVKGERGKEVSSAPARRRNRHVGAGSTILPPFE